ncbi:alpha-amlyase [Clostridium polyendosporum]|uniref:Alpha-amlyase n=1 Tax=Clostridium polyendosporum TaxID=69208 RepID=A0A919RYP9_9CLOT|nr:alpha-amylase family glycosyl hydrolase [Clostridium polyendosporum]GIM27443.1 alpha-amlyase [Clostridium polyendosporum]
MKDYLKQEFKHAEWSKNADIYEVNLRQFTPDGTIKAFEQHLPRLKDMGVDILWLMPIQPIGLKNRKGGLGSNYSVQNYMTVNPEFGTLEDFKHLVKEIHKLGMYVIIDWVANHTSWDNVWVTEHPEWYKKNERGEIHDYIYDNGKELEYWTDVVGLDYKQPTLWDGMIEALTYWVKETDIDGYRCDVAGLVPTAFWERARLELDNIKPVFMLAEWSDPELHNKAFDMTYDWDLYDLMSDIVKGKKTALDIQKYIEQSQVRFPNDAYRMLFTSNHDKNAWEATDTELFGQSFKAFAVLAATLPGMPLIYGGQESVLDKRLAFFEKDIIDWKNFEYSDFYRELLQLKKNNPELWNGQYGGEINVLEQTNQSIFAFTRTKDKNQIIIVINFSDKCQRIEKNSNFEEIVLDPWSFEIINIK